GEVAARVRYAGACVFCLCPDCGEVYERWRAIYWIVLHNWRADGWLATLGRHGISEGGDGQHQPVFRRSAGATRDHGEYGEPRLLGCVNRGGTDPARVAG